MGVKRAVEGEAAKGRGVWLACLLAWIVPGAGHLYLRKYAHAAVFFAAVTSLAVAGWLVGGEMHSPLRDNSGEGFLQSLAALGNIALGAIHLVFHLFGLAAGEVTMRSYEYGTTFIIVAALVNLLVVMDAYDHARGVKK